MTAPPILVTGAPRSGTGYTSTVLNSCGIHAGHEAWWGLGRQQTPNLDVDVSWLGAFDTTYAGRVFAQVRNPLQTIPSIAATWLHPWTLVYKLTVPLPADPTVAACQVWLDYTERAIASAEAWWRVEDLAAADLLPLGVDATAALTATPKTVNARPGAPFQWPKTAAILNVLHLAEQLGYDIDDPR